MEMVTSVAARWGYTDLSRFGALHKARYRETPAVTPESASQKYLTTSLAVLQWYSAIHSTQDHCYPVPQVCYRSPQPKAEAAGLDTRYSLPRSPASED